MKRIIARFKLDNRHVKLKKTLTEAANAWKSHANIDVEVADDGSRLTYLDQFKS